MKTRKTVLLSAIAILLCIYIVQLVNAGRTSVKNLTLKTTPAVYAIKTAGGTVSLTETDGKWIVGDKKYPATDYMANEIKKSVMNIKVLSTAAHSDSEAVLERYGLDKGKAITVTASSADGKVLRTVTVGKESSTGSQTYIRLDSGKEIYLASGSLKTTFNKTVSDLRSKQVYSFKTDDITHIAVAAPEGAWELDKSGTPAVWSVSAGDKQTELDTEKVSAWVNSLPVLNVESWGDEQTELPAEGGTTVTMTVKDKKIAVTVYTIGTGDKAKYIGTSPETPYKFYLNKYMADKYLKKLSDLKK